MSKRKGRRGFKSQRRRNGYYLLGVVVLAVVVGYLLLYGAPLVRTGSSNTTISTSTSGASQQQPSKPVILYVNQGNGVVNASNFQALLNTARSHGFNTIFFQIYRSGVFLFASSSLQEFVTSAHAQGLKIFFALYFTNSTQQIPSSVYGDGEDGINLDMSTLPPSAQTDLLSSLTSSYSGTTAVTSTDMTTTLKPDMLILETYGTTFDQYIHPGIIGSVGVFTTSSEQQYEQELQYALNNSDGVMVFDYAGLVKAGY